MTLPPRFSVTAAQIQRVVAGFYREMRHDPELGPVFAAKVSDWPAHEAKIAAFWRSAILHERRYDGNPMQVHIAAGTVKSEHFSTWLALFDKVLERELPADVAQAWSHLTHRIGRGLRMGLEFDKSHSSDVPKLASR
jgi:hemoglobin